MCVASTKYQLHIVLRYRARYLARYKDPHVHTMSFIYTLKLSIALAIQPVTNTAISPEQQDYIC